MAKRILELSERELGDAVRDYVQKHHADLWRVGTFEVVVLKNAYSRFVITWTLSEMPETKKKGGGK